MLYCGDYKTNCNRFILQVLVFVVVLPQVQVLKPNLLHVCDYVEPMKITD